MHFIDNSTLLRHFSDSSTLLMHFSDKSMLLMHCSNKSTLLMHFGDNSTLYEHFSDPSTLLMHFFPLGPLSAAGSRSRMLFTRSSDPMAPAWENVEPKELGIGKFTLVELLLGLLELPLELLELVGVVLDTREVEEEEEVEELLLMSLERRVRKGVGDRATPRPSCRAASGM